MNQVVLIGRLIRDPELKFTPGEGKAVATFTLGIERKFTGKSGEKESDFINCVAWNKSAEIVTQYSGKGKLLGVSGRLQTRNYVDKEGTKKYVSEVICDEVKIIEWANSDQRTEGVKKKPVELKVEDPWSPMSQGEIDDMPF